MAGRPKKVINKRQFEALCSMQCTQVEICNVLGVSDKPLNRWCRETYGVTFKEIYKELRALGLSSLRRNQWKMAETVPSMAIWLGKQFLNQYENPEMIEIKKKELAIKEKELEIKLKLLEEELNKDKGDKPIKVVFQKASEYVEEHPEIFEKEDDE